MSTPNTFDPNRILLRLSGLGIRHRVAFVAGCCERLLPNYEEFARRENWGNTSVLRSALDRAWRFVHGEAIGTEEITAVVDSCLAVTPDTEDFSTPWVSHALDAAAGICTAFDLIAEDDPQHAVYVASMARDSVYMFVQERDDMDHADPDLDAKIHVDPLMIQELKHQIQDLEELDAQGHLTEDFLQYFRAKYQGRSNLILW